MKKDFQTWHRYKERVDEHDTTNVYFQEREIWFVSCGVNVGFEQDGKGAKFSRPVVVIKKFNQRLFWGIPLTKAEKNGAYYFQFTYTAVCKSTAIMSQLRLWDAKRLIHKDGTISIVDFHELKAKIRNLL